MPVGAGDTPPRGELPRPDTGAAISPTPPDTSSPTIPRAHSPAAASQPYSDGPRVSSHRAPGVQSPGLPGLVLPPGRGSPPCVRRRTVTGGLSAEASRRKACHTPSSLRTLVAVSVWQARRRFHIPGVAAAPLRVDGCHRHGHGLALAARTCARHSGAGTGLPHGVERRYCPAHVWQALQGGASRYAWWQPPASGQLRSPPLFFAAAAFVSASAPAAASQAPCVPDAHAAAFHIPSVAAAAASRRAPATGRRLPHILFLWQPNAGTKPGGLVPLPDPLSQQFNQQSNEQLQIILGRVTHPPASSFRARLQAWRSRRLPPIPDAPRCNGLHASAAALQPYLHRTFR